MRNDLIYRQAVIDRLLEMAGFESVRELYECMVAEKKEARWLGGVNDAIDEIIGMPSGETYWHETFEDDPITFPDDDRLVLVSFSNYSVPMLGRWEADDDGGKWCMGDMDETFTQNDLYVDGWWELPKKLEPHKWERGEQDARRY